MIPSEDSWQSGKWYFEGDEVVCLSVLFRCILMHKSNVFGNDQFDKGSWIRLQTNPQARLIPRRVASMAFTKPI